MPTFPGSVVPRAKIKVMGVHPVSFSLSCMCKVVAATVSKAASPLPIDSTLCPRSGNWLNKARSALFMGVGLEAEPPPRSGFGAAKADAESKAKTKTEYIADAMAAQCKAEEYKSQLLEEEQTEK